MTPCTHDTSIVEYDFKDFSILLCTWGCGEHLIELKLPNNMVKTLSISEVRGLAERIAVLEARLSAAVDDQLQVGASE